MSLGLSVGKRTERRTSDDDYEVVWNGSLDRAAVHASRESVSVPVPRRARTVSDQYRVWVAFKKLADDYPRGIPQRAIVELTGLSQSAVNVAVQTLCRHGRLGPILTAQRGGRLRREPQLYSSVGPVPPAGVQSPKTKTTRQRHRWRKEL